MDRLLRLLEKIKHQSSYVLIGANLIPLAGVLVLQWSFLDVLLVYVLETGVIGFYNIFKVLTVKMDEYYKDVLVVQIIIKFFCSVFFAIHFGAMAVLLGAMVYLVASLLSGADIDMMKSLKEAWPGILSLLFSHGYSFKKNYIEGGEYTRTNIRVLMISPYLRLLWILLILFLGAAGGGVLMMYSGTGIFFVVIFIFLKITVDVISHEMERRKLSVAKNLDSGILSTMDSVQSIPEKIVHFVIDKLFTQK